MAGRRSLTPPRESMRAVQSFSSGLASVRARSPGRGGDAMRLSGAADEQAPLAGGGQAPADMETHSEALFAAVDRDGSGLISFEEFQSWWLRRARTTTGSLSGSVMDEAKAKWNELDRDGSGDLDAAEFEALLTSLATSDWKEAYDPQRGKSYYYNRVTKETRWQQADGEAAVSEFLSQNGVSVQRKAKFGIAAIGRAKQQAGRLANSEAARKAREKSARAKELAREKAERVQSSEKFQKASAGASEQSARARAAARQKAEQVQASEKFQKASAGASEFYASAEVWKTEAKTRHRDKLIIAGLCLAAATLLAMMFMYEWVTYVPPIPPPAPTPRDTSTGGVGETGQIAALTHEWEWVKLNERYTHPVVVAGVASTHEQHTSMEGGTAAARDPAVPRVQSIQEGCPGWRGWCFQIMMQEPECMEDGGVHLPGETLSWMVIDRGVYRMQGQGVQDKLMQAGIISSSGTTFVTVVPAPFDDGVQPVILTQVQTYKDPAFVKTRQQRAIGYTGGAFEVKLEQGYGDGSHGQEEIGWFAVEPSAGSLGTRLFEAEITGSVNHVAHTLNFQSNFSAVPLVFANIGTFNGAESATVRSQARERHLIQIMIHEDSCVTHNTHHAGENLALFVIQSDSGDRALRAKRLAEPNTFCPASGTYFTFVDTGQFISWSLAKKAADHHVIPTAQRPGMKSHLATIKTKAEHECLTRVGAIALEQLHEVAVGWIGATDAEWIPHWFDTLTTLHGDARAGTGSDGQPWTRYSIDTAEEPLSLTEDQLVDCGSLGRVVGGVGLLGRNQYIQKRYGVGTEQALPYHTAVKIELDFVKIDTWDGERASMWVEESENPDVENPVWTQRFQGGCCQQKCGVGTAERVVHIQTTVRRRECSTSDRPEWCSTLVLKFNSTLDQPANDESFGIQNIIISFRDENHEWRWGGDDNSPLMRQGSSRWSPAASDAPALGEPVDPNSPWHPGQPSGPTEHYVAVEWPHWEPGAWHDCESETQVVPPVWPRCFYNLHSTPRQQAEGYLGPAVRDDVSMISSPTAQWPRDNKWGMTMVLDVIEDHPDAPVPGDAHLNIMHLGDERGETSPGVWIVPHATERKLHIRTSTNTNSEYGCTTEDLNGQASDIDPQWIKPQLGRPLSSEEKQHIHLTVTVNTVSGRSRLYVYINGHIASEGCNGQPDIESPGVARSYQSHLFVGGDPYFGGFKGEVHSICLHPNFLDAATVQTLFENEVLAAEKGVHVDAAGSNARTIEELTDGRVLTNLAIPFRWDDEDTAFSGGTDSVDIPASALHFPGGGEHSDAAALRSEFAIEMTLRVLQRQNGRFRNVFHLGNDEKGFAHVCMLETHSMNLIIGVAHQGETNPRSLAASCTSNEEFFLAEDVLIVYSFVGTPTSLQGTLYINGEVDTGCSFIVDSTSPNTEYVDTEEMRGKMFTPEADGSLPAEMLHFILGDVMMSRHSIDLHNPGFYGDISRIVLHEQTLEAEDVFELYEPHCGKHLHGYYVESTLPPLENPTGGGGSTYDPDACDDSECVMAKYLTLLMLGVACPCCMFFAFVFYEKPPMLDVAPGMMPTVGGDDPEPRLDSNDADAFDSVAMDPPRKQAPPALEDLDWSPEPASEPQPEPSAAATSPPRSRPPSLAQVGRDVRNAQRFARAATPERPGNAAPQRAPPRRTTTPPRRAAPSLDSLAASTDTAHSLSPARRRDQRPPDLEETELKANISGMRAAFEQGQAPGASLHELRQTGDSFRIRTASPQRTGP